MQLGLHLVAEVGGLMQKYERDSYTIQEEKQ